MVAEAVLGAGERSEAESLSRLQMLERIQTLNPTANTEFLTSFDDESLGMYLQRLNGLAAAPRGRRGVWVRRGATPAMVYRESGE